MASIEKRQTVKGATVYIVKSRTPDGKHRTKGGFTNKKAAEAYATNAQAARLAGVTFDPNAGKVLFRDVAAAWLGGRTDLKNTTRAAYTDALAPTTEATLPRTAKRHERLADLRIDTVFGGYPINAITDEHVLAWVQRMLAAGKARSTIRNALFLVRQVLRFAVVKRWIPHNPAADVKLPRGTSAGEVDDPTKFLIAAQVSALVAATPWPFNAATHLAAWSGLRAAELSGLQVGDVSLPANKLGMLSVTRGVVWRRGQWSYDEPKTRGSRRRVPLTPQTTVLLADYLAQHPRRHEPSAPLFPSVQLAPATKPNPLAAPATEPNAASMPHATSAGRPDHKAVAQRQATALATLSVREAAERLVLDWGQPYRHATFYKAVFRPAVVRANRAATATGATGALLPAGLTWHALRHTYASLCIAAGLSALEVSRFMGHSKPTTTLAIYTHLFSTDDHADAMAALGAMAAAPSYGTNVVPLRG